MAGAIVKSLREGSAIYVRIRYPAYRRFWSRAVGGVRRPSGLVDGANGFAGLDVWSSDRDVGEVVMVSRWDSQEAFTHDMRSDEHQVSHDRISVRPKAAIKLERLDHLRTCDVVDT
jgi:heme-degrading monooxygenase HmoA